MNSFSASRWPLRCSFARWTLSAWCGGLVRNQKPGVSQRYLFDNGVLTPSLAAERRFQRLPQSPSACPPECHAVIRNLAPATPSRRREPAGPVPLPARHCRATERTVLGHATGPPGRFAAPTATRAECPPAAGGLRWISRVVQCTHRASSGSRPISGSGLGVAAYFGTVEATGPLWCLAVCRCHAVVAPAR